MIFWDFWAGKYVRQTNLQYGSGRTGKERIVRVKMTDFCNSPGLTRREMQPEWGKVKNWWRYGAGRTDWTWRLISTMICEQGKSTQWRSSQAWVTESDGTINSTKEEPIWGKGADFVFRSQLSEESSLSLKTGWNVTAYTSVCHA